MPASLTPEVSPWQRLVDHLAFPLNMWLAEETSARLGLTPIDHERVRAVLPHCRGRLLDVGCGNNLLVRTYKHGIGVDVHRYADMAACCDSAALPFRAASFDSVTLLACLNHITRRPETLAECGRVLRRGGRVVLTMIPAWVGVWSHKIRKRHDPDQLERGIGHDEELGMPDRKVRELLGAAGFRLILHRRFMWGLNNLYVAEKEG
jgi:SAM-dependent methyltransferase